MSWLAMCVSRRRVETVVMRHGTLRSRRVSLAASRTETFELRETWQKGAWKESFVYNVELT